jgi:hypothetical protein
MLPRREVTVINNRSFSYEMAGSGHQQPWRAVRNRQLDIQKLPWTAEDEPLWTCPGFILLVTSLFIDLSTVTFEAAMKLPSNQTGFLHSVLIDYECRIMS